MNKDINNKISLSVRAASGLREERVGRWEHTLLQLESHLVDAEGIIDLPKNLSRLLVSVTRFRQELPVSTKTLG